MAALQNAQSDPTRSSDNNAKTEMSTSHPRSDEASSLQHFPISKLTVINPSASLTD